jgi:ribosome maturation factor RimP
VKDFVRFTGVPVQVELYEPLHAEGFPEAGRRKLQGRILAVEGEPGNELIRFAFEELEIARTPAQAAKMRQSRKKPSGDAKPVEVTFSFQDVDRANLIPQLDFRGNK